MIKAFRPFPGTIPVLAVLAVAGWLLYMPALRAPFVFDDLPQILENPHIRITDAPADLPARLLKCRYPNRPLAYISFALNYYYHQYDPAGYRAVNVIIHILTAFLVFLLARLTPGAGDEKPLLIPFLAAALWLVNPVHTQSVTYIVQRMNALAAMFVLLALCAYVQARRLQSDGKSGFSPVSLFVVAGISGLCGIASKENAAILPVIILLYEWYFFQDLDRNRIKKHLAWIGIGGILLVITALVYTGGNPLARLAGMYEIQDFTPGQRLLTEPRVIIYYLTLIFFPDPDRLNLDYDFIPSLSLFSPLSTLAALAALLALTVVALYTARRLRLFSFTLAWFLVTLAIESSFVGLALIFEHRTYLPSVFPAIMTTSFLVRRLRPAPVGILAVVAAIAACGYATVQRNRVWDDNLAFWQDNVRKSPGKAIPCNNLGLAYKEIGDFDKALYFSRKALALREAKFGADHPEVADSLSNVGLVYQGLGEYDRALAYHFKALSIARAVFGRQSRELFEIYNNIGIAYDGKGDFDQAIYYYQQALDIDRGISNGESLPAAAVYNNLGGAWYNKGGVEKAIGYYEKSLAIRTKLLGFQHPAVAECYNNIGLALGSRGRFAAAISCYRKALDIEMSVLGMNSYVTAVTIFNLGLTCHAAGDYDRASFYMRKVLSLYGETLGRHHPYILTAESILQEALKRRHGKSSGVNTVNGATTKEQSASDLSGISTGQTGP